MVSARSSLRSGGEAGSALVVVVFVAGLLGMLALGYLMLAEGEARQSALRADRVRCRLACRDVLELAATWFEPTRGTDLAPAAEDWLREQRGGDVDGDGLSDPECDGSRPAGRLLLAPSELLHAASARPCGRDDAPDLLLGEDFRAVLGASLGRDVVVERLAVHAPPPGSSSLLATLTCRVAVAHGRSRVFVQARGVVAALPGLRGPEVLSAGEDLIVERGGSVRWGAIEAAGVVTVPGPGELGFPASGLPRATDGRHPADFASGGVVDWNLRTKQREYVLTELLGWTLQGRWVREPDVVPLPLSDPWLSLRAGERVIFTGEDAPAPGRARQPFPHDARARPGSADLSHVSQRWENVDPLLAGRARDLAREALATPVARRFFLAPESDGDEPTWREGGRGRALTAAEWIALEDGRAVVAVFTTGGRPTPTRVTLRGGAGVIVVEADEVVLEADDAPAEALVNMPGEPFLDEGVDADEDGLPDPGTFDDGSWDADLDDDGVADAAPDLSVMDQVHADVRPGVLPDRDADEGLLEARPHEAFLNLRYPDLDGESPELVVDYAAGRGASGAPIALERDGEMVLTTTGRDDVGALARVSSHAHALVVNLTGDVVLDSGFRLHGAVRAAGTIRVRDGAVATFDEALGRTGWPANTPSVRLVDVAWSGGAPPRPTQAGEGAIAEVGDVADGDGPAEPGPEPGGSRPPSDDRGPGRITAKKR